MKTLIDNSLGLYIKPFAFSEIPISVHIPTMVSTFDTFDKVEPELYICDPASISPAVIKNMQERPSLKVVFVQRQSNEKIAQVKTQIESLFGKNVYPWIEDSARADLVSFGSPEARKDYAADIVSFDSDINSTVANFKFSSKLICRFFSYERIKSNYYCGFAQDHIRKNIYKSSKVSISYGDNFYNSAICDCFPVSANEESDVLNVLSTNYAKKLKDIKDKIYSTDNNFVGLFNILDLAGYSKEAKTVLSKVKDLL